MDELRDLQRWMLAACTTQSPINGAETHVAGTATLPATNRIGIYSRGYVARLREHLRDRYPTLRAACGDHVFDLFALAYIHATPPRGYSVTDYGADFADYLQSTAPVGSDDLAALPAALARYDQATQR